MEHLISTRDRLWPAQRDLSRALGRMTRLARDTSLHEGQTEIAQRAIEEVEAAVRTIHGFIYPESSWNQTLAFFDRSDQFAQEWESHKGVLAALGIPEERFDEHKVSFTVGFWRGEIPPTEEVSDEMAAAS